MWLLKKNVDNATNKKAKKKTDKSVNKKKLKGTDNTVDKKKSKDIEKNVNKKNTKNKDKTVKKEKQVTNLTEKEAQRILNFNKGKAKELLKDKDSMNNFLNEVNDKFNTVTGIKEKLEYIPIIISLIRSYINGEYRKIPTGSLIGLVAALIYFLSPVNVIPDFIPLIGQVDDIILLGIAVKLAYTDLEDYKEWLGNKEV